MKEIFINIGKIFEQIGSFLNHEETFEDAFDNETYKNLEGTEPRDTFMDAFDNETYKDL